VSFKSKLIIGTVQFGIPYGINNSRGKVHQEDVAKILLTAHNHGINKLDTSYAYGDSESTLGKVTSENNLDFLIISKIPPTSSTAEQIIDESLSRLHLKKLYGYLIHDFDSYLDKPGIWEELTELKNQAKVSKIGFSLYTTDQLEYLLTHEIKFDLLQFPYNILDRSFYPYLEGLKKRNVEIHVRSVFLQGLFFKDVNLISGKLESLLKYLMKIHSFCAENNISIEEMALNYVLHNPYIDGVLIGVDCIEQLERNIDSVKEKLSENIISFIESINVKEKSLLNPGNWQ
jgi:uncharacterized protein